MTNKENIELQEYLDRINNLGLKGIIFSLSKNGKNIVTSLSSNTLLKGDGQRVKLLLFLGNTIAKNKKVSVKDIVSYLENTDEKKLKILNILNKEVEKNPKLKEWIEDDYPYVIKELEEKTKNNEYIIKDEDGNIRNLLFEFIEKVSKLTRFVFKSSYPQSIQRNMKDIKKWLLENNVKLQDLEWYFDNIYSKMVYDGTIHKSIKWFLVEAQEYFINPENYKKELKALLLYLKIRNESTKRLAVGSSFKKYKKEISSILYHIDYNLEVFDKILKDFSNEYRKYGLNWTLKTLLNNLFQKYQNHIKNLEDLDETKTNKTNNSYPEEFLSIMKEKNITDDDIIMEYYNIYKSEGIEGIKEL